MIAAVSPRRSRTSSATRSSTAPVELRSHATDESLVIEVQNHGSTIPPERIASMFEPDHRGESSSEGLGLYIVAEITRAHGGRVECSSIILIFAARG